MSVGREISSTLGQERRRVNVTRYASIGIPFGQEDNIFSICCRTG